MCDCSCNCTCKSCCRATLIWCFLLSLLIIPVALWPSSRLNLYYAIRSDDVLRVERAFSTYFSHIPKDHRPNINCGHGKTLLHVCAQTGAFDVCRYYLDLKYPSDSLQMKTKKMRDIYGVRAHWDVNARNIDDGSVPLHYAAAFGKPEMVRMLIQEYGASYDIMNIYGWTPLHQAIFFHNTGSLDALLEMVDPQAFEVAAIRLSNTTGEYLTPLQFATFRSNTDAIIRMINAGFYIKNGHQFFKEMRVLLGETEFEVPQHIVLGVASSEVEDYLRKAKRSRSKMERKQDTDEGSQNKAQLEEDDAVPMGYFRVNE